MSWGYEILFDVADLDGLTPLERAALMEDGDRWKQERTATRRGQMGYRTKTTTAGPRLEAEIYPIFGKEVERLARKVKKQLTPEKIQRHNDEKARRHLVQLMDANFGKDDLSITLTYDEPAPGVAQMKKDIRNFVERMKRARAARKLPPMKYIYAMEWVEEGRDKRPHCHFITQGDMDEAEVKKIWGKDTGICNIDRLQPGPEGLEALATYIYRQNPGTPREKGRKKYGCSKNLKKPKTRVSDTKVTRAKVKRMANVFEIDESEARRIMERLYPGYDFVRGSTRRSDIIDGVYIRVLMRKKMEVGT